MDLYRQVSAANPKNQQEESKKKKNDKNGGVEVLNKDTIDPQTVKRLGKQQVDDILAICKRHKGSLTQPKLHHPRPSGSSPVYPQTGAAAKEICVRGESPNNREPFLKIIKVNRARRKTEKENKQEEDGGKKTSLNQVRQHCIHHVNQDFIQQQIHNMRQNDNKVTHPLHSDELPEFDFPLTLKNYNTRRVVQGWEHGARKLDWLIRTAVSALDTSEPDSRRRLREDRERKARMARATGLGDPDDVRPGEFGMSFSEKEHWRMHLDQLHQLIETAPVRISAKIDPHVQRIWNLNRKRGRKDVEKTHGMYSDFAHFEENGVAHAATVVVRCGRTAVNVQKGRGRLTMTGVSMGCPDSKRPGH